MKKIVYMAITHPEYILREPRIENPDWQHICFTTANVKLESNKWEIIKLRKPSNINHVRFARKIKACPHLFLPEHDISIWLDAKFTIRKDLNDFADKHLIRPNNDFVVMDHHNRSCPYAEQSQLNKEYPHLIPLFKKQMDTYKENGLQENSGLFATGILIRKNNYVNRDFGEHWFDHIKRYSHRDMLSFAFLYHLYKDVMKFKVINFKKTYESFMYRGN